MKQLLVLAWLMLCSLAGGADEPVNVVILGDSNTWIGGDGCDQPQGWNKWFKDDFAPTTCRSYARSGATWTNTVRTKRNTAENTGKLGDDNVIYNQVCRLKEAVDSGTQAMPQLILVMAGTNDLWFMKQRPKVLGMTAEKAFAEPDSIMIRRPVNRVLTLAEAVCYNCRLLKAAFPKAHIVLLTPMQSTKIKSSQLEQAATIIEECGERLGASVIRTDSEGCVRRSEELQSFRLTRDGVHTNEEGAQCVGSLVTEKIRRMRADGIF